jgi:hypothetical protein
MWFRRRGVINNVSQPSNIAALVGALGHANNESRRLANALDREVESTEKLKTIIFEIVELIEARIGFDNSWADVTQSEINLGQSILETIKGRA